MDGSEKITIRVPLRFLRAVDFLVEMDDFPSRSEVIRAALRDFLYDRVDLVMDKAEKMKKAEETLQEMENFREKYLRK